MQGQPQPQPQYVYPQQPVQHGGVQQTTVQMPGPTVNAVYQQAVYAEVDVKACKRSGGAQVNLGLLCVIFGITSICIECEYSYYGTAIWGGVWFMVTGFLGASVPSVRGSNSNCQLSGYLVLGVFSAIYALDLMILTGVAIGEEGPQYSTNNNYNWVTTTYAARVAIDSVLLTLGIMEFIAACWGVVEASKHVCGTRTQTVVTTQPAVVQYTTTTATQGYYPNQPPPVQQYYLAQPGPSMQPQPGAAYPPPAGTAYPPLAGAAYPPPAYVEKPAMPPQ